MVFLTTFPTFQNLPDHQRNTTQQESHGASPLQSRRSSRGWHHWSSVQEARSRRPAIAINGHHSFDSKTWSRWVRLGMLSAATATRMRPSPTTTCLFCFKTIQRLRCDAHALHPSCSLVQRANSCARSPCTSMRLGSERGGDVLLAKQHWFQFSCKRLMH